ncbi:MAG: hypothetical protein JXA24_02655 [Proteobacteria bacterium]|nr:hypothetical protein [Pseudomonadota bacterium]
MSEPVIISAPAESPTEPFSDRWGLYARYGLRVPLSTSVTEGGLGHTLGLGLEIAENFEERYALSIEVPFGTTEQKILPTSGTADHDHRALMIGLGRFTRSYPRFGGDGDFRAALTVGTTPLVGFGRSEISRETVVVDGERFEFDDSGARTFDIGTNYFLGGEFRPWGRGPVLSLGPALHYGLQYEGEGSEFNRIKLELMLMAQIGYGDGSSVSREESEGELGALGITQGLYSVVHAFLQRIMYDKAVGRPMEALEEYGLLDDGGSGDRGSMADVPLLSAGSAFLAANNPAMTPALRSGEFGFWGFGALGAAGGVYFLAAGSDSAKAAGLADLLGAARLVSYSFAGINTPVKRLAMLPEEVEKRQMSINLASYALNSAVMLIGAAAGSDVAMGGGAGANAGVSMSPDPVESTTVERTDIGYIPYTAFFGSERNGNRAGIIVHKSWHDFPAESFQLFSSVMLVSPMLTLGNIGNMPSEDEPYDSPMLTSDVSGSLGLEWKTTFTRLSLGIDTRAVSGSSDSSAGVGAIAGFDLIVPFNGEEDGSGIVLGVRGTAHKLFPGGSQAEISPVAGVTLHF